MKISKKYLLEALSLCYIAFVYLWIDGFYAVERFKSIGINVQGNFGLAEHVRQVTFVAEYSLAIVTIFLASRVKNPLGAILLVCGWTLTTIDLVTHNIYGRPADLSNISVLNASIANLSDATQQYSRLILEATAKTGILFIPLLLKGALSKQNISPRLFFTPLALLILIYAVIMVKRGAPALVGYPKGFSYGFGTIALIINDATSSQKKIDSTPFTDLKEIRADIKNIVVIIDESVEYEAFDHQLTSTSKSIINFGRSFSGGNCSAPSNYVLRKGFWERSDNESLRIQEVDSLFKIAKRHGFSTTYIDNQEVLKDPTIRNYIDKDELQFIDGIIENGGAQYERDARTVDQIHNMIKTGKNFILVNKNGAHFPYANTLAPSLVTSNNSENYSRSIQNNSINFVTRLAENLPANTISFYTSDHGQELNARGTHCNTGDSISTKEYAVPFLIITSDKKAQSLLLKHHARLNGNLTHIEFSESIRNMMGESIPNANSAFKFKPTEHRYCGLYGQPLSFFGTLPSCKPLSPGLPRINGHIR